MIFATQTSEGKAISQANMSKAAAHEFGYILGIQENSQDPKDIMSVNGGEGVITEKDASAIRQLYEQVPSLIPGF